MSVPRHPGYPCTLRTATVHRSDFSVSVSPGEHRRVNPDLAELFDRQGGVATTAQILQVASRRHLQKLVYCGAVQRIWHGVYGLGPGDDVLRLRGLDLACGEIVTICLGTAARAYGFDTEDTSDIHVLNPLHHQIRSTAALAVHRREGAPLRAVSDRLATAPGWTAIEVSRMLPPPRALATLDAALRSGHCDLVSLAQAAAMQSGRRGIVKVRALLELADGRAESPMESEARLVMIDGGLPAPVLQYEVIDGRGQVRRLDFAWPEHMLAAEYDSDTWHSGVDALRRDREKLAALQDLGWTVVPIVVDDVRRRPQVLVDRIQGHLRRAKVA